MTQKFPKETVATVVEFRTCGWGDAISGAADLGEMSGKLAAAARTALDAGRLPEGKVLWLLADASSMMLHPASIIEPFRPLIEMGDKRTALPEDFVPGDIELFGAISAEIDSPPLRARLADLAWLLGKPKNPTYANCAIDAYMSVVLNSDDWYMGGRESWARAIALASSLKAGAGDRLARIESALISAFDAAAGKEGYFAFHIAQLLHESGMARSASAAIARTLTDVGATAEGLGNFQSARDHYTAATEWLRRTGTKAETADLAVRAAECWVKEAGARASGSAPSYMVAASFYENAIQAYRAIPRKERERHGIEEKLSELYRLLADAGQRSLSEMSSISSPPLDITELADAARDSVRGKTAPDALLALTQLYAGPNVTRLKEAAIKSMRAHPLSTLFSSTHVSKDGRVIAKTPGGGFDSALSPDAELAIWAKTVRDYVMEIGLVVQAQIWPAYEMLCAEHRLHEMDFASMLERSPIVPKGRVRLFAKGLFAGYDRDFTSAIHLLIPQVENLVRFHLKAGGVKTTNLDKDGIENENGLSTLVDLPEMPKVFGENLAFELKALFCDPFGPNMRNQLAHGLLDYDDCVSTQSVYVWWLVLRLTFVAFWNSLHKGGDGGSDDAPLE